MSQLQSSCDVAPALSRKADLMAGGSQMSQLQSSCDVAPSGFAKGKF